MDVPASRWLGEAARYEPVTAQSSLTQGIGRILQTAPDSYAGIQLRRAFLGQFTQDVVDLVQRFDVPPWSGDPTVGQ